MSSLNTRMSHFENIKMANKIYNYTFSGLAVLFDVHLSISVKLDK